MAYNKKSKNILKFITPASSFGALWREGLVSGNGTIGVNVLGGAGREVVVLNHASLFWQGNTGVLPDVSDKIKNIKKNLDIGNYREAEAVLTSALNAKNYRPENAYPLPLCDIVVNTPIEKNVSDYYRSVNLETGEIEVSYKDRNVRFVRDIFVSRANDTICYELTASGSKRICCEITLSLHDKSNNRTPNFESFDIDINSEIKTEKDYIIFTARNDDGTDFGCVSRILCSGGTLTKNPDSFSIKNADKVVVLSKVFVGAQKETAVEELKEQLSLIKAPYEKLLKEHSALHSKLMNTTEINLNSQSFDSIEEALLFTRSQGVFLSVLEKLYVFGKYLFVCSNKSPYGLFNGDYKAYQSTTENYLQLQRLFNFAFKANLTGNVRPLFDRLYDNLDDYKKNSTRLYGCKGIFVPSLEAPESGLPGSTAPGVVLNFNVAAYICAMIFQYYLQTDDVEFIKEKGYEILEETGFFYEDILKINKTTKVFESPYGYSPFNTASNVINKNNEHLCIASNCVCDFVCAKYVFSALTRLAKVLEKEEKDIEKWQALLDKVPDVEVDKDGVIKEYNSNAFETNNFSPFIPHLFPYNVGLKPFISKRDFEDLIANSVVFRYSNCSGLFNAGNLVDMAVALSTCGEANASFEVLSSLIRNFVSNNLIFSGGDLKGMGVGAYDPWATFSIDKNIALCACVQNMFINSCKNTVSLFRNLPSAFTKGSVYNLTLDNQIRAELEFNLRRGIVKLKLRSPKSTTINLSLPNGFRKIKGIEQTKIDMEQLVLNGVNLQANKAVSFKIYFHNKV